MFEPLARCVTEAGTFPLWLLIGSIVAIVLIKTVGKCDNYGHIYH